jgi:cell wall-associated NlpC family hydrolase
MRRIKLLTILLVVFIGVTFSSQGIITFAKTTRASSTRAKKNIMSKAKVKVLQTELKSLGYFRFKVDGNFGPKTTNAVKSFQKSNKILADGIVGPKTTLKIKQKLAVKKKTSKKLSSRSSSSSDKVMKVIDYAKRYLGVDYNFGSASPDEFDCSGFTMFVFKIVGINLPHSAAAQANIGQAISKSNLEPGDLVFFQTYKPGISHVGIYLGNEYFIHASSGAGHVTITSLSEAYYTERFRGGARILND